MSSAPPPSAPPPIALRDAVAAALPGTADRAWQALRGGRVNRCWRVGSVVVKAHDPEGATPLFPNDPEAEAAALRLAAPAGLAPALVAAGAGWIAWVHAPGRTWRAGAARAARLIGRVGALALPPERFRALPAGSAALRAAAAALAPPAAGLPPLPPDPGLPPVLPRLVHGDAVPGNLILGPAGDRLIDWQCPGLGDPAEDIAAFLSPAMQFLYRGWPLSAGEVAAFLAAWPRGDEVARYRCLAPLLHWRLAAHCAGRALRGDAGYAQAARIEIAALTEA